MTDSANHPGPGRSTAEAAVNAIKKQVAERNEKAHQQAKRVRRAVDRFRADRLKHLEF